MEMKYEGNSLKPGVYQIRNLLNEKVYIGSAKRFKERWQGHLRSLEKGTHHNKHLQSAYNLYGTNGFVVEILELVSGSTEERRNREQEHIDGYLEKWDMCYNVRYKTIEHEPSCFTHTPEETRKKLSAQRKGRTPWNKGRKSPETSGINHPHYGKPMPAATKEKLIAANIGRPPPNKGKSPSPETRKKIGDASRGRKRSPETNEKIREKVLGKPRPCMKGKRSPMKGKQHTEETKALMSKAKRNVKRPKRMRVWENIKLLSPEGILHTRIDCLQDFAKEHGVNNSNLYLVLIGKRKMHKGWTLQPTVELPFVSTN